MQGTKQNILKKQLCAIRWMVLACYILRLWPFILALLACYSMVYDSTNRAI